MQLLDAVRPQIIDTESDMPLNDGDRAWIRQSIQDAHKRSGLGRLTGFIKDWSGTSAAVAILILAFTQWNTYTEFRVHTSDRLDAIDKTLLTLRASDSPAAVLTEISELSDQRFAANLPALQKVAEQRVEEVKPTPPILHTVARKLLVVDERSPNYWATVLQFIAFASSGLSPDVPPPSGPRTIISRNIGLSLPKISHEVVELDGGELFNTTFENSRIIFTENPVKMVNVTFTNCVFELPVSNNPNPYIQNASRSLLASTLKSASISL